MGQPRPLFCLFSVFLKQTSLQFLLQIYVEKCPSSIRCRDSNPRPSECESLPFTTRPGLPPYNYRLIFSFKYTHKGLLLCLRNSPNSVDYELGRQKVRLYNLRLATLYFTCFVKPFFA